MSARMTKKGLKADTQGPPEGSASAIGEAAISDSLRAQLESRDQRIRELTDAAKAVVEGPRDPWVEINALQALLGGATYMNGTQHHQGD